MSGTDTSTETESGRRRLAWGVAQTAHGCGLSFSSDENLSDLDGGGGRTTL